MIIDFTTYLIVFAAGVAVHVIVTSLPDWIAKGHRRRVVTTTAGRRHGGYKVRCRGNSVTLSQDAVDKLAGLKRTGGTVIVDDEGEVLYAIPFMSLTVTEGYV